MQLEAITYFASLIEKELGIVYSESNYFQLQNRLEEIAKMRGFRDIQELLQEAKLGMSSVLKQLVLDVATNNETSFFRDAKLFQGIKQVLIPKLIEESKGTIRIWSAACSSGQEAYSVAMLIQEQLEQSQKQVDFKIIATDISSRILQKAQEARYSQLEVQRGLPANLMIKYFQKDEQDYWSLKPQIRNKVEFHKLNLLDPFDRMDNFDVILCRNVLIYQDVENKKKCIQKITAKLTQKSVLILGAGESMIGLNDNFDSVKIADAIVYQLKPSISKVA